MNFLNMKLIAFVAACTFCFYKAKAVFTLRYRAGIIYPSVRNIPYKEVVFFMIVSIFFYKTAAVKGLSC